MATHFDLSFHRNTKERDEVHDKNRPEHRNIKHLEEGADECNCGGFGDRIPELEFG